MPPLILGLDPGRQNNFWVTVTKKNKSWVLVDHGQLDVSPDMPLNDRLYWVRSALKALLDQAKPTLVASERFISRPGFGMGNAAEIINITNGMLYMLCSGRDIPIEFVMPAQHKIWWEKTFAKKPHEHYADLNKHASDAFTIAVYAQKRHAKRL